MRVERNVMLCFKPGEVHVLFQSGIPGKLLFRWSTAELQETISQLTYPSPGTS